MTDRDIFETAIEKAEQNGYKEHFKFLPEMPTNKTCAELLTSKLLWNRRYEIIFSHKFAKAFWGIDYMCGKCYRDEHTKKEWEHHLQEMVLQKNPFKYLEQFND